MASTTTRTAWLNTMFLFGVPVIIGVILGGNRLRAGAFLPWGLSVAYWLAIVLGTWLIFAVTTRLLGRLLVPWNTPPWVAWAGGAVLGSFAARPLIYTLADLFRPFMSGGELREMRGFELSADFLGYYLANWVVIFVLWVGACALREWLQDNLVWDAAPARQREPGSGPAPPSRQDRDALDAFLRKLPPHLGRDVIALQSEDHYVRIHTGAGNTLLLSRISDAAAQLEAGGIEGQRVHRSWWVARDAVEGARQDGRKYLLVLRSGLEVPVSQTYREVVRLSGLLPEGATTA